MKSGNRSSIFLLALSFIAIGSSKILFEDQTSIPDELCQPFGMYPNVLNVSEHDESLFFPVIIYPDRLIPVYENENAQGLATPEEIKKAKNRNCWLRALPLRTIRESFNFLTLGRLSSFDKRREWGIGKYDENRVSMYTSELFQNASNSIDGYAGLRTVHLGVDLGAPVGTKIYAFCDGVVHSAGYNEAMGDYGYAIVIEHHLPSTGEETSPRRVWALYGHLDKGSIRGKTPGKTIKKGQVIARVGDCHENGGWTAPHLHFQLSMKAPDTHDMPGASSLSDRKKALLDYPDPRYILGPVH